MRKFLLLLLLVLSVATFAQTDSAKSSKKDTVYVPPGPTKIPTEDDDSTKHTGKDGEDDEDDDDDDETEERKTENILEPLLSYNYSGKNSNFSNLTPVINYGWQKKMTDHWTLSINPYAAGQINVKDSSNILPALMMPGIVGLKINSFIEFPINKGKGGTFVWYPLNFGLKVLSNFLDSNQVLMQTNIRTGFGYSLEKFFQFGVTFTHGWHSITSESEENFKKIFQRDKTSINFLTIVLETYIEKNKPNPSLLFFEWRGLLKKDDFKLPNSKILTIGFRKEFSLDNLAAGAKAGAIPKF